MSQHQLSVFFPYFFLLKNCCHSCNGIIYIVKQNTFWLNMLTYMCSFIKSNRWIAGKTCGEIHNKQSNFSCLNKSLKPCRSRQQICCLSKECDINLSIKINLLMQLLRSAVFKKLRYQTKVIKTNKTEASYTTLQ